MKIIVATESEKRLFERLLYVLETLDAWSDIQKADYSIYAEEDPQLSSEEYRTLRKNMNSSIVVVDKAEKPIFP